VRFIAQKRKKLVNKENSSIKIKEILENIVKKLEEKENYLNRLDAQIGDGDHGRTIVNAFKKAQKALLEKESGGEDEVGSSDKNTDIGTLLKRMGRTLAFSTGAAAGPLYGTAFIEVGKVMEGKREISLKDWVKLTRAAEAGIIKRGRGKVGEKTMLDTLHPMVETLKETLAKSEVLKKSSAKTDLLKEALLRAKEAAQKGMESTRKMVSKRGRSSRLGERTRGHIDPGAASSYYIIEAIIKTCLKV